MGHDAVRASFAGQLDPPAPETDTDALLAVVRPALETSEVRIAEYLIASLDRHGILDQSPADAAAALGVEQLSVLGVLTAIRQAGPPGVGATSIKECLLKTPAYNNLSVWDMPSLDLRIVSGEDDLVHPQSAREFSGMSRAFMRSLCSPNALRIIALKNESARSRWVARSSE